MNQERKYISPPFFIDGILKYHSRVKLFVFFIDEIPNFLLMTFQNTVQRNSVIQAYE